MTKEGSLGPFFPSILNRKKKEAQNILYETMSLKIFTSLSKQRTVYSKLFKIALAEGAVG